ncbi:MAG: CPBP family intramembrane metalloprotease [Candidatus Hydrogenedentes bacterium]|nr:CPBP family intramembrane metalloprotease [Candidatus Hydrogenedentota bacterium]
MSAGRLPASHMLLRKAVFARYAPNRDSPVPQEWGDLTISWKLAFGRSAIPLLVIATIYAFGEWFKTTALYAEQMRRLYWNYLFHLAFFLPPCVALILNPAKADAYGLSRRHIGQAMKIGALFAVPLVAAPMIADGLAGTIHLRPPISGRFMQSVFYQIVMVAVAEELLFRGYVQGELNRAFPAAHRLFGCRITAGFWVTAILFWACHVSIHSGIGLWDAVYVAAAGLLFGILRERTQSLAAPALAHFGCNFYRYLFGMDLYAGIATGVAWFFIFWSLPRLWNRNPAPPA